MTMTREEAIKELYAWLDGCCGDEEIEPAREAFRMAIEALRVQDVTDTNVGTKDGRTIYRQAAILPEIIRCKDCKYWQDQEEGVIEVPICARPANKYEKLPFVMLIGGDGFCSYAERSTDE